MPDSTPGATEPAAPAATTTRASAVPIVIRPGSASGLDGRGLDVTLRDRPGKTTPPATKTEVTSLRTEHTRTYALPDGTYSLEAIPGRLNYRDANGNWQPVDLSLKASKDATFGLQVASLDRSVSFGTGAGSAGIAKLSTDQGTITLRAPESGPSSLDSSTVATTLPTSTDDTVSFAPAIVTSPELSVHATDTGFEFSGTWTDASIGSELDLVLDTGTLVPVLDQDGRTILFTSVDPATKASKTVGGISAPVILEGGADGAPAIDQSVVKVALSPAGVGTWALTYTLDATWLADPARIFPVVLDPAACLGEGASGCDLNGTGTNFDHFVVSGLPTQYPTGWSVMRVGYDTRGYGYHSERGLVYFESLDLPDGAVIYDTDLQLHISSEYGSPDGLAIHAYNITDPWSTTTTWDQFGTGGNGYSSSTYVDAIVPTSGYMHWDPDGFVQAWYAHRAQGWKQNLGFALRLATESSTVGDVEFDRYSDATAAYRPLLRIAYVIPNAPITFDSRLGADYSPSTMLAGTATTLPVTIRNLSGSTMGSAASDASSYYALGYRFFDEKGNVASSDYQSLPANLANNASVTMSLPITPPAAAGQYSLRLDIVRYYSGTAAFASDYADPSKYYARAKYSASPADTRWVGTSVIERNEYSVSVVATTPPGGEWKSVPLGDGSTLAINLWSRDLEYEGSGGVGFDDLLPVDLSFGYRRSATADATGILRANGWYTNFDERLIPGSGPGDFVYQDPEGNRTPVDTNADGQMTGAGVLLSRPRVTIWDESGTSTSATLGDPTQSPFASPTFPAFSGRYVLKAGSGANVSATPGGFQAIDLNQFGSARFAVRTSSAASAGVAFKIHNVTSGSTYADRWFVYTLGTNFTSGFPQVALGLQSGQATIVNTWNYYSGNLINDVVADGSFGLATDDYQLIGVQLISAGANSGFTYLDALRIEGKRYGLIADSNPAWSSNGTGTGTSSETADGSTASVKIPATAIAASPDCVAACWASDRNLAVYPYLAWDWRKAGGGSAAVVLHLVNMRSSVHTDLTYYAGPNAPAGATNAIQVADSLPEGWVHVVRNVLEDARTRLNWFDDTARETHTANTVKITASLRRSWALVGATSGSPNGPDDAKIEGYSVSAVDGSFLLFDAFEDRSVPEVGPSVSHPSSVGDTSFAYDFSATYPDGTVHYFNSAGLLVRISDRNDLLGGPNENKISLEYSVVPNVTGQAAYTLTAIHAPTDATTTGGATFRRRIDVSGVGTGTVSFTEQLGTVAGPIVGRSTVFTVSGGDVTTIKPARTPVCGSRTTVAPAHGSGCVDLQYDTSHNLQYVADPRWDGSTPGATDYRFHVSYAGNDPAAIGDMSNGDSGLVRVLNYSVGGSLAPASTRVLWQDAAAARSNSAMYLDLTADGRALYEYAPIGCTTTNCLTSPPPTTNLASQITVAHQFDGLARVSSEIAYRCPADSSVVDGCGGSVAEQVVSRQATKASAAVDNFSDPLTASEVAWTQTPDEYASSLRDAGTGNSELYRTTYTYDEYGRRTSVTSYSANARADYAAAVKNTTAASATLKGYWRLGDASGAATDSSGGAHNGTATGIGYGATGTIVGDADKAMSFDGTTSRISASVSLPTTSYTLETWMKVATAKEAGGIVGRFLSNTGAMLYLNSNGNLAVAHADQRVTSSLVPTVGRWYHVVGTWDGTTIKVYIDGALAVRSLVSTAVGAGSSSFEMGSYGNGAATTFFEGALDEVAVYSTALTPAQVEAHYLAGRAVASSTVETTYDNASRPTQVDNQMLASGGFESGLGDWEATGSACTTCTPHLGLAAYDTGATGKAVQDVQLVPGQTFRFQYWAKSSVASVSSAVTLKYFERSSGTWKPLPSFTTAQTATNTGWTSFAWDVTLGWDTDGRVRAELTRQGGTASDHVYFDDVALLTSWANASYHANGTVDRNQVLRPGSSGAAAATIDVVNGYAADTLSTGFTAHPAIWPTSTTANYQDGLYDPTKPDEDVKSQATFDAWGRTLVTTDPDGVTSTTAYNTSSGSNGYLTDVLSVSDAMGGSTTNVYDLVGNVTSSTTAAHAGKPTLSVYDLSNHVTKVTAPDGTVRTATYDPYGFRTMDTANAKDGVPTTGTDDLVTRHLYDALGNENETHVDCASANLGSSCAAAGFLDAVTRVTHDLLGNAVATTTYPGVSAGGSARTTTAYFETTPGPNSTTVVRPKSSALRAPLYPTASPAPACPDTTLTAQFCSTAAAMKGLGGAVVSGLDLEGQTVGVTDAYGVVTRTFRDLAGRPVFTVANYADGSFSASTPDEDVVSTTQYDLAGQPAKTTDVLGRSAVTARDALERAVSVTTYDSAGAAVNVAKTVYTPGGRTDRVSSPDTVSLADASRTWTKTVYDLAGRAAKTLDHYDSTGNAGLAVESFEAASLVDNTIANDQVAESWSSAVGTFVSAGATATENHAASTAVRGTGTLDVTPGATGRGVEWKLDGTFASGHTYKANAWVNAPSGTSVTIRFGTTGDPVAALTGVITGNGTWQKLAVPLSWAPTANRTGNVVLAIYASTGTGTFRVDDAVVYDNASPDSNVPTSETAYDKDGAVITTVVPPGAPGTDEPVVTTTARDDLGRPTTVTVNAIAGGGTPADANLGTTTAYDELGRAVTTTDPKGIVTTSGYDRLGHLTSVIENDTTGTQTASNDVDVTSRFGYDVLGELTGYCPAAQVFAGGCDETSATNAQAWHYSYDDGGHLSIQTPPVNVTAVALASTRWEYDEGGRVKRSCDTTAPATTCSAGGASVVRTITPGYDALGRTIQSDTTTAVASQTLRTTTSYFGDGQPNVVASYAGSPLTLADTITYQYDTAGRQKEIDRVAGATTTILSQATFFDDGQVATRADGDNGAVGLSQYTYDWANRLTRVTVPTGFGSTSATFGWRADGLIASRTWSTTTAATFNYDNAKRPTQLTRGSLTIGQAYDRDGNVTSESRSIPGVTGDAGTGTQSFTYDNLNRVTGSSGLSTAANRTYVYDRDGNRTQKTEGGTTAFVYTYDRTDELVTVKKGAGSTLSFAYDSRGNLTSNVEDGISATAYGYDAGSRLTLIDPAGTTNDASFTYDALGRLRTRALATATETYAYVGGSETVTRITPSTGTTTDSVVSPAGDRLGVKVSTTVNWFLPDLHGSIAASLTGDESKVSNAIRYDAYGQTLATGSAAGATPVGEKSWKYQGRLDIAPAGLGTPLYEAGARLYAPGLGTFTSLDSVMGSAQNPGSMNRFLYAEANPATMVDPTGHTACSAYADFCEQVLSTSSGTKMSTRKANKKVRQQYSYAKTYKRWGYEHEDSRASRARARVFAVQSRIAPTVFDQIASGLGGIVYDNAIGIVNAGVDFATHLDRIPGNLGLVGTALTHLDLTAQVASQDFAAGVEAFGTLSLDQQIRMTGDVLLAGAGPKVVGAGFARAGAVVRGGAAAAEATSDVAEAALAAEQAVADAPKGGVYSLRDVLTDEVVRTGRSKDLTAREAAHAADPRLGRFRFQREYLTDDYATQRGLEVVLYRRYPQAMAANGGFNKVGAIAARNPNLELYRAAAAEFLMSAGR